MKKPKEGDIVKACLSYLQAIGVMAWRSNTGATERTDVIGRKRFVRFGTKGSPDIMGIMGGGRFLGIECKMPGKPQSDDQRAWEASCKVQRLEQAVATAERAIVRFVGSYSWEDAVYCPDELPDLAAKLLKANTALAEAAKP